MHNYDHNIKHKSESWTIGLWLGPDKIKAKIYVTGPAKTGHICT